MARRKRGGKLAAARKIRSSKQIENVNTEEVISQSPSESEESCSSGTPKSCNTPIEIEKNVQSTALGQHKKFGKFPLVDETVKMETNETDIPFESNEFEQKENETIPTDMIIERIKSVDINEVDSQILRMCADEIVQEDIAIQVTETVIEDTSSCEVPISSDIESSEIKTEEVNNLVTYPLEIEENSNEDKSTDSNSKSNESTTNDSVTNELSASESKGNEENSETNSDNSSNTTVRRSSRIRSISVLKQRSKGRGLVRSEKIDKKDKKVLKSEERENVDVIIENEVIPPPLDSPSFATPTLGIENEQKPVKVKSRWRRSSELEMGSSSPLIAPPLISPQTIIENIETTTEIKTETPEEIETYDEEMEKRLRHFETLTENEYLTDRTSCKEARKMVCDCFLVEEEIERGEFGCGEDCLNRLLMIECGSQCVVGDRCTNKRFQKLQYAPCEVFRTIKKGFGIKATAEIPPGEFILEYVGEVLDSDEFDKRAKEYSKDKNRHYYFMALRSDAVIDATQKGNISRFINHSCDPNAETQKWTVNGELRIGFFSKRTILPGEEITFDYQFQRYGKEAQKCYCESSVCRGWIGEEPGDDDDEDEDEDEDEEDDDEEEEAEKEKEDTEQGIKTETGDKSKVTVVKEKTKRETKKRRHLKKQRKDIFEDLDLDDEIEMLSLSGVKNQTHTLKLSRLMVRAKELAPRMQLLKLLSEGEEPCRRLFLDYHGLKLIHGWMSDATSLKHADNLLFRLEILKALDSLPIKNKTILQDSKVLSEVEKWSICDKTEVTSPDSDNNSPNTNIEPIPPVPVKTEVEELTEIKMDIVLTPESVEEETDKKSEDENVKEDIKEPLKVEEEDEKQIEDEKIDFKSDDTKLEVESMDTDSTNDSKSDLSKADLIETKSDSGVGSSVSSVIADDDLKTEDEDKINEKLILSLSSKLLERWLLLKEDFRIPKKERIKQMKEHEREADRDYKEDESDKKEPRRRSSQYSWKREGYNEDRGKTKASEHERSRKTRLEDRNIVPIPQLTKHERRQLFALKVAQEEEGRRRKQQEMWRHHEQRCLMMGQDPRLVSLEMSSNFPCYWNGNMPNNNWPPGSFPPAMAPNIPPNMAPNMPPNMAPNMGPSMPPNMGPNMLPNMGPNMPLNMQPNIPPHSLPPNMGNIPPNVPPNQMFDMQRPQLIQNPPHMPPMMLPPQMNMTSGCINGNMPPLPQQFQTQTPVPKEEQFVAPFPLPPPVKLPPKWKCAKDKYGRPYYYHVKIRVSQWEPPEFPPPVEATPPELTETSSSSETSSLSSDSSSDSEDDSELGDTKLLLEIRNKLKTIETKANPVPEAEPSIIPAIQALQSTTEDVRMSSPLVENSLTRAQHKEQVQKRKREGLVQEIIISPRREEDKIMFKADMKRYKETKEKLRRQKELLLEQTKKKLKSKAKQAHALKALKKHRSVKSAKHKIGSVTSIDMNSEEAKRIKEEFRKTMATIMVQNLNSYRKPECKIGRITNTEDFKHLARKLTHFVMVKEIKHCQNIEELACNESVKAKAKDFVKKYMCKFGEVYTRPKDDIEY